MSKRALLYGRVSTNEQAEKGFSLTSQLVAMRKYAAEHDFTVVAEITDDCSGTIPFAERPGGRQAYQALREKRVDVIVLYTIDRTARDKRDYPIEFLLFLRDVQDFGAELHYVDSGKSEGSIIDLFKAWQASDERRKIIERSVRGRITKAKSGKWPCDGHAAYGYRQVGNRRTAHLEIDVYEAQIVCRIFAMYIGLWGKPMTLPGIAAVLNSENVPPPNRGGAAGKGKKGLGWHRHTLQKILHRRAYIGEFSYAGNKMSFPELAIMPPDIFKLAESRYEKNRALVGSYQRKHYNLLVGHLFCSCGMRMNTAIGGKNKRLSYYLCNSKSNRPHMRTCRERMIRADLADPIIWNWIIGLLSDQAKLSVSLEMWQKHSQSEQEPRHNRLTSVEQLIAQAEHKIKRLTTAFADELDDMVAEAVRQQLKDAGRERTALIAERDALQAALTEGELSADDVKAIQDIAREITGKVTDATYEQKRALLNMLDVRVKLVWKDEQRWLIATCGLTLPKNPTLTSTENSSGTWLSLQANSEMSSSITTTSRPSISSSPS